MVQLFGAILNDVTLSLRKTFCLVLRCLSVLEGSSFLILHRASLFVGRFKLYCCLVETMEEGLYISDNEIFGASDVDSDEDSMDDQFEEVVVVYDEEDIHQEIQFRFGGYDYEFVDEVSPNQKCRVCLLPMRDAVQTSVCGHRFCRDCLLGILRSDYPVCPNDRQEIEEEGGFFIDKAWTREILSLQVKCKQSERGCDWIGEVRYAEEHQRDCPYEDTECGGCDENIQRRHLQMHLAEECPKRVVECVFCRDEFYFIKKQEHEQIYCRRFPLVCENNCGKELPREEMAEHISEKCCETIVSCSYSNAGCPYQDKRGYLNEHNEATVEDHLEMVWAAFASAKEELDSLKDLRQKFDELEKENERMKKKNNESEKENQRIKEKFDEAEKDKEKMKWSLEVCQIQLNMLVREVQDLKHMTIKTAEEAKKFRVFTIPRPQRPEVHRQLNDETSHRRIIPKHPRLIPESNAAHTVTSNTS